MECNPPKLVCGGFSYPTLTYRDAPPEGFVKSTLVAKVLDHSLGQVIP